MQAYQPDVSEAIHSARRACPRNPSTAEHGLLGETGKLLGKVFFLCPAYLAISVLCKRSGWTKVVFSKVVIHSQLPRQRAGLVQKLFVRSQST